MSNACKDCLCSFDTLEACLRHEILEHLNLNLTTKKDTRRGAISEILRTSAPGSELEALIKLFYVDSAQLETIGQTICGDLRKAFAASEPNALLPYGSLVNGLMLKDSDVDIFVEKVGQQPRIDEALEWMKQLASQLRESKKFHQIILVSKARVPIVKCLHAATQLKIDINCFSGECVGNTLFFRELFHFDVRLRTFARFMKIWFKQWRLIGQGLISSYCFATLLLFYLQRIKLVPSVQRLQYSEPCAFIDGVNYAFELYAHMRPLPVALSTHRLIKDFFLFFEHFNFVGNILSTYLGKTVSAKDAKCKKFLLTGPQMTKPKLVSFEMLQTDSPLIVHDSFQLHLNISKAVSEAHLAYFQSCIKMAAAICTKMADAPKAELYEALLYGNL